MNIYKSLLTALLALGSMLCSASTDTTQAAANGKIRPASIMEAPEKSPILTLKERTQGPVRPPQVKKTASTAAASSDAPLIYATLVHRDSWGDGQEYGIYSFSPSAYGFEPVVKNTEFNANGGAGYIGDDCYLSVYSTEFGSSSWVELHAFNTKTWRSIGSTMGSDAEVATDFTYCPADKYVYGCYKNVSHNGYVFGRFDTDKLETTSLADLSEAWIACASDASGNIYAVTVSGKLVTADRSTGAITEIGNTGVTSENLTSGAIDCSSGLFYVATCDADKSALYSIDLTTASATLLYEMQDGEELAGMYIASEAINPAAPAAVTDLKANFADYSLSGTVSFRLPSTTMGGDPGSGTLIYAVTCDNKELKSDIGEYGQTISLDVTVPQAGKHDISVVTMNSEGMGPRTTISIEILSRVISLPYQETFDTEEAFKTYTINDYNQDGYTFLYWINGKKALCMVNFIEGIESNDGLSTPYFNLEKGKHYTFSCEVGCYGTDDEAVEVRLGKQTDSETTKPEVIIPKRTVSGSDPVKLTYDVVPEADGAYYFEIYCLSSRRGYGLTLDNVRLAEGVNDGAPDAPGFTVTPDYGGELSTKIELTAPSVDAGGNALRSISLITICRDGKAVHTIASPAPGASLQWTDTQPSDGYHTYTAYAENAAGTGRVAEQTVYVGVNYPAPPTNVTIVETPGKDGEVTMTWDAPATDADGNPLNPTLVTYMIGHRMSGTNLTVIKRGHKETNYTFQALDPDQEKQKFVTYLIFSETSRGVNDRVITATAPIAVGHPLTLPYRETFGGNETSPLLSTSSRSTSSWSVANDISDQDGDGYYLYYESYRGDVGTVTTGKITLSGDSPTFSLYYFAMDNPDEKIEVSVNAGEGFVKVGEICINDGDLMTWQRASVSLKEYSGKTVQLRLVYKTIENRLAIDNMCIESSSDVDLSARALSVPLKANPGVPFDVRIFVANNSAVNPGKFSTDLYRDGYLVDSKECDGIEPYGTTWVTLGDVLPAMASDPTAYIGTVECDADINPDDNFTATATVNIEQLDYPVPASVVAENSGNVVRLTWDEPVISREDIVVTDDVEDYRTFSSGLPNTEVARDNIGYWTTVDADGYASCVMLISGEYLRFPNANSPTSFIVFDAEKAGVPEKALDSWRGRNDSKQCFMVMTVSIVPNDKWLISPLLSGKAQTISFYAKSPLTQYGLESFEVLYSTGSKDISEFVKVGEVKSAVPAEWTRYTYDLPEGALYFAIRSTSDDVYALLVDDITFEKAHPHRSLELSGYNVYRNAELTTSSPLTDREHYIVEPQISASTRYNVTAVFKTGESAPSADVHVGDPTAIDDIDSDALQIMAGKGYIDLLGADGEVTISRIDGVLYFKDTVQGDRRILLPAGIYIADTPAGAYKIIVR